ncbi:matrix remodeling-associated protein 8 [Perognathus longimembris pacificus]|uniref:matrix remodeling-associated protein 8 n=1 Tax=Perognathus longimembris pacificus TaxID=214514 RepID=UPI00201892B4|nr:matrix remodeling-associated protein 8 [Perognathus longimembris pacificus]
MQLWPRILLWKLVLLQSSAVLLSAGPAGPPPAGSGGQRRRRQLGGVGVSGELGRGGPGGAALPEPAHGVDPGPAARPPARGPLGPQRGARRPGPPPGGHVLGGRAARVPARRPRPPPAVPLRLPRRQLLPAHPHGRGRRRGAVHLQPAPPLLSPVRELGHPPGGHRRPPRGARLLGRREGGAGRRPRRARPADLREPGARVETDRHLEEAQQVVHWDRQPPGVPHDRADRLLDLYASGERRAYGPPFLRDRAAVRPDAFARGDFSLRIGPLEPADEGTYSCHLHHHYCGLHERRIFHLRVSEPAAEPPRDSPGNGSSPDGVPGPDPTLARGRSVINVIVPEGRAHFFQQLGYVLATLLLFILLLITVVLATRQRRRGGCEHSDKRSGKAEGKDTKVAEFSVATGHQPPYRTEDIQLDYKNNILKERAELAHSPLSTKNIDLDKEFRKEYCK